MSTIKLIWILIQVMIGYNLLLPLLFYFIYLVTRRKIQTKQTVTPEADYGIIVTAYEQTELIPDVIKSIQELNYSRFIIYIVADKCDVAHLKFADPRVVILRPEQVLASNTKSHFYAIDRFIRDHERLTIIDSDNLVHPEYLNKLNIYFDKGYEAVQGTRAAKNLNTHYACLDAARDIYYHFYDGKLLFEIGSSATLAGSGMAFTTTLYKKCLANNEIKGAGFDKVLQFEIVNHGYRIAFAKEAIVFDEKTIKSNQLVAQRARWIYTWFKYFALGFKMITKGLIHFNRNQFLFGLILLRPPLFIFLLLSLICVVTNIFLWQTAALIWLILILLFTASFFIALVSSRTDKRVYQSLINIPKFVFYQLIALTKIRTANKLFVATQHFNKVKE